MLSDAEEMLAQVEAASAAADLFGASTPDGQALRRGKRLHRVLAQHLHPDRAGEYGIEESRATAAFARLSTLYEEWISQSSPTTEATARVGGASARVTLTSASQTYVLGGLAGRGTIANVYRAAADAGAVAVKMPRNPRSSAFMAAERRALHALGVMASSPANAWLSPYYPHLLDTLAHVGPGVGEEREANVLDDLSGEAGFLTLAQVKDALPTGLDGRDWAWIHRRLLTALAGAHLAGLVHGAVLPENILIHPEGHGVILAGWSFATRPGRVLAGRVRSAEDFYPPEASGGTVTSETDIYMAHALMLWMLAPEERRQRAFARGCMQDEPRMRPDAAGLLQEYDELLDDLYGKRTFRVFPTIPTAARRTA